jgi:RNA polymerase sigma-70 factor (ECF subfamily)
MADESRFRPDRTNDQVSTEALVQRIGAGDAQAEHQLLLRYRRSVLMLAQRMCQNQHTDAEDVVQDVFAEVIAHLRTGSLRDPASLPHYLRQAVQHRASQQNRWHPLRNPGQLPERFELHDPAGSPLQQIMREEGRQTLLKLVRELPSERDRELLLRFFGLQQDREQICSELQIDPLHFRRVLSRARSRMRELIERAGLRRVDRHD